MKDEGKTRDRLIEQLRELRRRVQKPARADVERRRAEEELREHQQH